MTRVEQILAMLDECQVPMRAIEIAKVLGYDRADAVSGDLSRLAAEKRIRRVSRGMYEPADRRTVGDLARVEVKRDVKPVVLAEPKIELEPKPSQCTVSVLLEAIANSGNPKMYAGVLREISDTLAYA